MHDPKGYLGISSGDQQVAWLEQPAASPLRRAVPFPGALSYRSGRPVDMDTDTEEEWRDVVGWEGFYEVSSLGRVRSIRRRNCVGGVLAPDGVQVKYLRVKLQANGRSRRRRVHVLVAEAFLGPRPVGPTGRLLDVCHKNGDNNDNRVINLRYDTRSSNMRDTVANGAHQYAKRTACSHGHEYTPESTRVVQIGPGADGKPRTRRVCRTCRRGRHERVA